MSDINLSTQQQQILIDIIDWFKAKSSNHLTLGGYAGTGKTTLVGFLSQKLRKEKSGMKIAFCSYTGKATRVLSSKLHDQKAILPGDYVGTIHRLIYAPILDKENEIIGWERRSSEKMNYDLIIVDEASMVNYSLWQDLVSLNIPILAVGDHGQLPPIEGKFNLMEDPQLKLEEIYRQQAGNPIIKLSEIARRHGEIPFGTYGRHVRKMSRADMDTQEFLGEMFAKYNDEMLVLVGYNHTRVKLNNAIRGMLEFAEPTPQRRERVICLRNNHAKQIYNGMMGEIQTIKRNKDKSGEFYTVEITLDGSEELYQGDIAIEQFGAQQTLKDERREGVDLFDFGYAITVHKSQGSQADKVIVFEERFKQMDDEMWRRWLYTAVTRAVSELYIVG